MLVVPIQKDIIHTKDGSKFKVVEYTNYKEGGPAVYARSAGKDLVLVYFFDIDQINKTKVEYQRGMKLFEALGKINREQHLPQPDDKIVVLTNGVSDDQEGKEKVEVDSLKLKSKSLGINKGLHVKDTDGNYYRLKQILDIDRALGGGSFDRDAFLSYYKDYTGV
jgi:hypothetical protein